MHGHSGLYDKSVPTQYPNPRILYRHPLFELLYVLRDYHPNVFVQYRQPVHRQDSLQQVMFEIQLLSN